MKHALSIMQGKTCATLLITALSAFRPLTAHAQNTVVQGFDGPNVNNSTSLGYDGTPSLTRIGEGANGNDRPANANFYTTYGQAWYVQQTTESVLFKPRYFSNTSGNYIQFRLAAWSMNSRNGGVDNNDFVRVFVSVDGGISYQNTLEVRGNQQEITRQNNSWWNYSSESSVANTVYDGDNTPFVFRPRTLGDNTGQGLSTVRVTLPSTVNEVRFYVEARTTDNDERWTMDEFLIGSNSPLPVELKSFTAAASTKGTQLQWATASEKNNASFEVQRGATAEQFQTIGSISGQGTSSQGHKYEWFDKQPLAGLSYYRLRQLDYDGTESFSPVVAVQQATDQPAASFFPNPSTGSITLAPTLGDVQYRVINNLGQALLTGKTNGGSTLDVKSLRTGTYFLELQSTSGRSIQRFVRE
ncbi:T9SS type A sorting domain-containing protein [Hymenobacter sp.]|jgi:hypothetical protein|uniref:T9SS type A sorting domain-containing protein n=1 Tax=Hymenobacter sp. TaxID=1898978 RepID=UPI002ED86A24